MLFPLIILLRENLHGTAFFVGVEQLWYSVQFPSRQIAYNKTVAPPGHDPATAEGAICSGGPGARGL